MPDARADTSAPIRRPGLVRIGYVVVGLTLFAAYLISTFPYSATLTKVLAPMGLEVSSTSQTASFPFGARLSDVRLTSTRPASAGLLVESPAVTIAPAFLSMLTMHPGVRVKADLYDGVVSATHPPQRRRHRYQLRPRLGRAGASAVVDDPRRERRRRAFRQRQSVALAR